MTFFPITEIQGELNQTAFLEIAESGNPVQ